MVKAGRGGVCGNHYSCESSDLLIIKYQTEDQTADFLTKPLPKAKFEVLRMKVFAAIKGTKRFVERIPTKVATWDIYFSVLNNGLEFRNLLFDICFCFQA